MEELYICMSLNRGLTCISSDRQHLLDFGTADWGAPSNKLETEFSADLHSNLGGTEVGEAEHDELAWNQIMQGLEDLPHM